MIVCGLLFGLSLSVSFMPAAAAASVWDGKVAKSFSGGSGTAEVPWKIGSAGELAYMAKLFCQTILKPGTTETYGADHFVLTVDVVLNDVSDFNNWGTKAPKNRWTSIGKNGYSMEKGGSFDGQGHTVTGMYIKDPDFTGGLFFSTQGSLKNIKVEKGYVEGSGRAGGIGSYIGKDGSVSGCSFSGIVIGGGHHSAAGIASRCEGSIENCVNYGTIKGYNHAGGIVAGLSGTLTNCINYGTVEGSNESTGGIAGAAVYRNGAEGQERFAGSITNACNLGTVKGNLNVGGLVGTIQDYDGVELKDSYNLGTVSGETSVGAVLGRVSSACTITGCSFNSDLVKLPAIGQDTSGKSGSIKSLATADMKGNGALAKMGLGDGWAASAGYPQIKTLSGAGYTIDATDTAKPSSPAAANPSASSAKSVSSKGKGGSSAASAVSAASGDASSLSGPAVSGPSRAASNASSAAPAATKPDDGQKSGGLWGLWFLLLIPAAGAGVFLWLRRKKTQQADPS